MILTPTTIAMLVEGGKETGRELYVVKETLSPRSWTGQKLHRTFWTAYRKVICWVVKQAVVGSDKWRGVKRRNSRITVIPGHLHQTMLQGMGSSIAGSIWIKIFMCLLKV